MTALFNVVRPTVLNLNLSAFVPTQLFESVSSWVKEHTTEVSSSVEFQLCSFDKCSEKSSKINNSVDVGSELNKLTNLLASQEVLEAFQQLQPLDNEKSSQTEVFVSPTGTVTTKLSKTLDELHAMEKAPRPMREVAELEVDPQSTKISEPTMTIVDGVMNVDVVIEHTLKVMDELAPESENVMMHAMRNRKHGGPKMNKPHTYHQSHKNEQSE